MEFLKELFDVSPDMRQMVRDHQKTLRQDKRGIEREMRDLKRDEKKMLTDLSSTARKQDKEGVQRLARLILIARRKRENMDQMVEHINEVQVELKVMYAQLRTQKVIEKSSKLMTNLNQLVSYEKMHQRAYQMGEEFVKAGLIKEMTQDAVEIMMEDSEVEEDEIDQIVNEALYGKVEKSETKTDLPQAPTNDIQLPDAPSAQEAVAE